MAKRVLPFIVCQMIAFVASAAPAEDTGSESVATISTVDTITHNHIYNLLASNGITAGFGGSVVDGVYVPKKDFAEAKRLLKADAARRDYSIEFSKDDSVTLREGDIRWTKTWKETAVSELLAKRDFRTNTALGLFLRSTQLAPKLRQYPIVGSLRVHERQYQAATNRTDIGYDVLLELRQRANDDSKSYRGTYQVWSKGREIVYLGGSERN